MVSLLRRASIRGSGVKPLFTSRRCSYHNDGRQRTSSVWMPTGGMVEKNIQNEKDDVHDLLVRAGYIRQTYSGIFHMLPLGLRVQQKLEALIDKHMRSLGASKLSLSSISSQELWERSGRLKEGSEVFRFLDRRKARYLLAPTHEEEITKLVGNLIQSYKDLPLRVYQISRKYRDEARPRQGLLRGREFIMKDLYSFDYSVTKALETYEAVRKAYVALFDELGVPFLVASADPGNMGGNLSHEFHFISSKGEDTVIKCSQCHHAYNEELADGKSLALVDTGTTAPSASAVSTSLWMTISRDKTTLIRCWYPQYLMHEDWSEPEEREINSHAIKAITEAAGVEIDSGVKNPVDQWLSKLKTASDSESTKGNFKILDVYDHRVKTYDRPPFSGLPPDVETFKGLVQYSMLNRFPGSESGLDLIRVVEGDKCQKCLTGSLQPYPAVELGHTFHLGTRYSKVLDASVAVEPSLLDDSSEASTVLSKKTQIVPMQMGCHGIGVSRLIAAAADILSDQKGLNWPKVIAPYQVAVLSSSSLEADAEKIYDSLMADHGVQIDVILDDRPKQLGWKLKDADLIGYPVIVILGKAWSENMVEVQCRRLGDLRVQVPVEGLVDRVRSILDQL